ncbi:alpha/beta hydrolase [Larkinella arboricola]|uniref:S-formylglutathione hydrolase FrmB n=1 Tax=Larkinella arboricola TaxID=643671 RepID=A0A327X5R1_LARAB|nr:alpha/beta hydrolase family protein [Larkinella arboricola]RAK02430.1 S-formylglutathione hydrolase FrmB [Larkinella arboricola]
MCTFRLISCLSLQFLSFLMFGAKVDTLDVPSASMNRTLRAAVVLPETYRKARKQTFPVLYLLHGGTGSFRDWLTKTPDKTLLHRLADQYNLIIVTPDGDPTSYYFDSPLIKNSQFETFISKELMEKIDNTYRTIRDRKGRVIAGLSMGGHGALFISSRHPELYAAAGSMSGVMNINTATWKVAPDFAKSRSENFARLLGPPKDGDEPYPGYTLVTLADRLKANNLPLILDIGVDDFLIETNRDLHRRLVENKTPHDYTERPGAHTWEYWENALPYQVLFFSNVLNAYPAANP